ncbi:MAG: hypothetical protein DRQ51_03655 [Gammaproteobacteria bacterium]|nr:MAG: hypothetical protein DRQ51_03655 [Gammaproteobacteria bacterium]
MLSYRINVIGAGSWGSALASLLAQNNNETILWGRDSDQITEIKKTGKNDNYLPNIQLDKNLNYSCDFDSICQCDALVIATPSKSLRYFLKRIKKIVNKPPPLVLTAKGLEPQTNKFSHQVVGEEMGDDFDFAILSGPTFAIEVAHKLPTATTIAATNKKLSEKLVSVFKSDYFRPYSSCDIMGVQIGGALKNVFAIAAGICDGLHLGNNAMAALINRANIEMLKFAKIYDCQPETIMGLSGMGDLILTCSADMSRNRTFGKKIAGGLDILKFNRENKTTIEGINTTDAIYNLAKKHKIQMPITQSVYNVLHNNLDPKTAVIELMNRETKPEL